jgi:hypothetical protein
MGGMVINPAAETAFRDAVMSSIREDFGDSDHNIRNVLLTNAAYDLDNKGQNGFTSQEALDASETYGMDITVLQAALDGLPGGFGEVMKQ